MSQQRRTATAAKSRTKPAGSIRPAGPPAALVEIADTLCNAAVASCTEHTKHAELVKRGATSAEQKRAWSSVRSSDEILDEAVDLYEVACLEDSNHADEAWWHKANMVWRAAKEYLRHVVSSNYLTRGGSGHGRAELVELSIEYELEASALLRLRHLIDSYRAARPGAA